MSISEHLKYAEAQADKFGAEVRRLEALNADLLAALEEIVAQVEPFAGQAGSVRMARAAIAKAKGEA